MWALFKANKDNLFAERVSATWLCCLLQSMPGMDVLVGGCVGEGSASQGRQVQQPFCGAGK